MNLTPREKDKLLVAMAAIVARKRLERGVKLNYPEAVALISDYVVEGARDGRSPSRTPRRDVLRNSTAIQRVLPMAARRAHKSECGERRRGSSRDDGLRRGVARGTC